METISKDVFINLDLGKTKRLAVFASYSFNGIIDDYVVYYLKALRGVVDGIIFFSDNPIFPDQVRKIENLVCHYSFERHEEYDFGSYKRGYFFAKNKGLLQKIDELIFCNDSCFGPLFEFSIMFNAMSKKKLDFWGITKNEKFTPHLQSYFLLFRKKVFMNTAFEQFLVGIKKQKSVRDVIFNYEVKLTDYLIKQGFKSGTFINSFPVFPNIKSNHHLNIEHFPCFLIQNGSPLIKVKAFQKALCNLDGIDSTLSTIKQINQRLFDIIVNRGDIIKYQEIPHVAFSIIMPTHNRADRICKAIESVIAQSHRRFELIIVDDGSTDRTEEIITKRYIKEINSGMVVYVKLKRNAGVCIARNIGLGIAQNPWIAYVDSDNTIRPYFLKVFASNILENPDKKIFYAQLSRVEDGHITGKEFDYDTLLKGNYIDLGVVVHHIDLYKNFGGFDASLKRLVDWDLILTYTKQSAPLFIPCVLLDYCNSNRDANRISIKEPASLAWQKVLKKHKKLPTITTIILTYNHGKYIKRAIESAISQQGDFIHDIILSDDGSTDGTAKIIEQYAKKYPTKIRNISEKNNVGISENFKRCFYSAEGEYLAILEGDDYWIDDAKLEIQIKFLKNNEDCSMVFSKIEVHDLKNNTKRTLKRQESLTKEKLDGSDFLAHPSMNLIANFSSCLFRSKLIKSMPSIVFERRVNEIAIAFYLEKYGKIGYIDRVMSVYQQHAEGLWSGADYVSQLKSGLETRRVVKEIAHEKYKRSIEEIIEQKYFMPLMKKGLAQ